MAKIWERKNPKRQHHRLDEGERREARRSARRHGRSRPSLVDNIQGMRRRKKQR